MTTNAQVSANVDAMIARYNATGRVAYRYPRKHRISLNGLSLAESTALARMKQTLSREKEQPNGTPTL